MLKRTKLCTSLMIAFGGTAGLYSGTVLAQDATATPQELQRITITGSNIRRTDVETPSPVQVITAADIAKSGYTTIAQVLQNITANGQGTLSTGFSQAFAGGASGISLRGLNTSATLVLIDGHRMAPYPLSDDGQRSFVDVSNIPFSAVERIEILKDGASAVYGSDAMAGVVNIILKKSFVGTTFTADGGGATEGGGTTFHGSVMYGLGDYNNDGYNAFFNVEYRHQDAIVYSQRSGAGQWTSLDWSGSGGNNKTPGVITPNNPVPTTLTPYLYGSTASTLSAANSVFFPGACSSFAQLSSGGCAYQNPHAEIQPQTQNVNLLGSFSKKLPNDWKLDVKVSWFDSQGEQYPGGALQTYPGAASPLVAVSSGVTPYLVGSTIPSITVPATYPGNTLGTSAYVIGVIPGAPIIHTLFDSQAIRVVADIAGSAWGWDTSTSFGYTKITTDQSVYGTINVPDLNAALNRTTSPFNILGGNTAADMNSIFPNTAATDVSKLDFVEVHAARPVMKLPGGDLSVSVGGSLIYRDMESPAPGLIAQGIVNGNNAYVSGSQTNQAIFAELQAPVLKSLELDASSRGDRFNNSGGAVTSQLKFKWTPINAVALRGSIGQGFRAPNAAENGLSGQAYLVSYTNDPVLCPGGIPSSGNIAAGSAVPFCSFQPVTLNSANPKLSPEKSVAQTLGAIFEPIRGWSTTLDFYQVRIRDQIIAGPSNINDAVRGNPISSQCADGNGGTVPCTTSVGPILYIPADYINANSVKTNGFELDSRYKLNIGEFGSVLATLDWSHTMSYILTTGGVAYQLAGTHGPLVIGGDTGNPKDRIQAGLTWDRGPAEVSLVANWISSFDLTDPSYGVTSCAIGASINGFFNGSTTPPYCRVDSFLTFNLGGRYDITKSWSVHGSVQNLFNRQPPVDLGTYGGGQLPYNPSMHQDGAIGRFINVGATFVF